MAQTCEKTWQDAMEHCRKVLGEDDFKLVESFESPESLLHSLDVLEEKHSRSTTARMLKGLTPHIDRLQVFWGAILLGLGAINVKVACFWGATALLLQLASDSELALTEVTGYLNDLGDKVKLFQIYHETNELDPETFHTFFDILVDLVLNAASAIKHFRKNDISTALTSPAWPRVHSAFTKTLAKISAKLEHLQKFLEVRNLANLDRKHAELAQQFSDLKTESAASAKPGQSLECITLPHPRNHNMHGRSALLQTLQDELDPFQQEHRKLRSVAVWGSGGIGKTQIALEYAHQAVARGLSTVLWISGASREEASRSFGAAAAEFQPAGYKIGNPPDQNKLYVLRALQKTDHPWLLIFDNVEQIEFLDENWPISGCGSILYTCRSELTSQRAEVSLEVPPFEIKEGCGLVLKILRRPKIVQDELRILEDLVKELGGFALALDIVARQMHLKKGSIKDFYSYFQTNRTEMLKRPRRGGKDVYYSHEIDTVWQTAFASLTQNSRRLLHLLCFMAPDKVPADMLSPDRDVPHVWPFMLDHKEFEDAKQELLDVSLIRVNDETGEISIHRVLQETYWIGMMGNERNDAFENAWRLLSAAFPRRKLMGHLYRYWKECEKNVQHVISVQDRLLQMRTLGFKHENSEYVVLISHACRYLTETENFVQAEKYLVMMTDTCKDQKQRPLPIVCDGLSGIYHRKACYAQDYTYAKMYFDITMEDHNAAPNDVPNAYSGLGLTLTGLNRAEEGLENLEKGLSYVDLDSEDAQIKFNIDRFLRNRGRAYFYTGDLQKATHDFDKAETWQTKIHGADSQFHGETAYMRAKIAMTMENYDMAFSLFTRAYKCMSKEQPTKVGSMCSKYQLGCVRVRQQKALGYQNDVRLEDEALKYFRDALVICQINEPGRGDKGESARVKVQMSKIMERRGMHGEARGYREDAEKTRDELQRTGHYAEPRTSAEEFDVFVQIMYR